MSRAASLLSLPVVAVALGALTLALLFAGRYFDLGTASLALFAIPVVLAVGYLAWYRTLPYAPSRPRPTPKPAVVVTDETSEDEPFEDPVEEADRLGREPPAAGTATSPPPGESAPSESGER